jgi:pimeloyl-ACP methyl ester carboxylesterase
VDAWRLHSRRCRGRGRTVVCVHGAGVASRYMVPTMVELGRDFDVIAPDLPGFGLSDKPPFVLGLAGLADALADWLVADGLGEAALLANSFGCQIAVECAVRRPDCVERLALVGPTVDPAARTVLGQLARFVANTPGEAPHQAPLIVRDYRDAGLRRVVRTFGHALTDRVEDKLPHVTVPALVIPGERDRLVPRAWAEEVTRLLPKGRLVEIPRAAHTLNFAAPRALAEVLRPFLAGGS